MKHEELLQSTLKDIVKVDSVWIDRAEERQAQLTKPRGSLGRLEEIANRLCGIQQNLAPSLGHPRILLFAADHGVCEEGVSPYPQSVTSQMVLNFLKGGAAINAIARTNNVDLRIVDVGLRTPVPATSDLVHRPIARGTGNLSRVPAMSRVQAIDALAVGIEMAAEARADGARIIGIGEMGIGNTTAAAAVTSALTNQAATDVVGIGAGADLRAMGRKVEVVGRAISLHRQFEDALDILSKLGAFEIAAMCGACLGAAALRVGMVADGFISTCAAALAVRFEPSVRDYLFAAHRSTEPGHRPLLKIIEQAPLLDLEMRLGEGTGAALAMSIIRSAVATFTQMETFSSASVSRAAEEGP